MRYNAFYGELPLEAFKPIGGRMRLYGGGDPISAVSDAVQGAVNSVSDLGVSIDQAVRNTIPGGWTTAALLAGGYAYAPDIAAYVNAAGDTVPISQVTDAAVATPVTQGTVTASALPPLADVVAPTVGSATGTALANAAAPAASTVAPAVAPTTLSNLGATDASLGTAGAANAGTGGTNFLAGMGDVAATEGAGVSGTGILTNAPATSGSFLSNLIPSTPMGQIAAAQGLTGLGSALIGSNAAQNAANAQSQAAQQGIDLQRQMFNTINQQQAPYRSAGYNALNQLGGLGTGTYQQYDAAGNPISTGTGTGYLTKQFGPADLAAGLAPNYDFMLQQGQMANQRAANVGGGALGGNALQGLQNYTQNYAGNAYQNAFQNFQSQRQNIYNTLAGIAGIGQTGQAATNTAAQNATNAQTQLGVGSAAAQAAGQIGTAGAYGNALGQLGSGLTLASLLNQRGNVTTPVA